MRPDYNKFGVFGARRANVTGWEHESPVSSLSSEYALFFFKLF